MGSIPPATVVVPLLRQDDAYLDHALVSLAAQTVPCDVVVVTAPETPASNQEIVARFCERSRSQAVFRQVNVPRRGFALALNTGFAAAAAPRVGILLSDDWLLPSAVEEALQHDADIVSTGTTPYAADGQTRLDRIARSPSMQKYLKLASNEARALYLTHFLLLRGDVVARVGGVDETLGDSPGIDDFDLLWTMLDHGASVAIVGRGLYCYRDHEGERLTLGDPAAGRLTLERIYAKHGIVGAEAERKIAGHMRWFGRTVLAVAEEIAREREATVQRS